MEREFRYLVKEKGHGFGAGASTRQLQLVVIRAEPGGGYSAGASNPDQRLLNIGWFSLWKTERTQGEDRM